MSAFLSCKLCQNSFAARCGSALTSHGLVRAQEVSKYIIKSKRSDEFRKQHGIQNALHSRRQLLRCPGPNGSQDFQLPVPRWPNFASASEPWAFEFDHPFAQDFPIRRWCTREYISWHDARINLQPTLLGWTTDSVPQSILLLKQQSQGLKNMMVTITNMSSKSNENNANPQTNGIWRNRIVSDQHRKRV